MSLIGIDVGSSSVKISAYKEGGRRIASARSPLTAIRLEPGHWEVAPEEVWRATVSCLRHVTAAYAVRRDPPRAIAISASGREAFPVRPDGSVLGNCLMAGDLRGADIEQLTAARRSPASWYKICGRLPERMDPVNRLLWWRQHDARLFDHNVMFLGWHEFLAYRLTGLAATDPSLASKWLIFDTETCDWSPQVLAEFDINQRILPRILPWGTPIGALTPAITQELNLPPSVVLGTGAFDVCCAVLGSGASQPEAGGLVSGSWEDLVVPTSIPVSAETLGGKACSSVHILEGVAPPFSR